MMSFRNSQIFLSETTHCQAGENEQFDILNDSIRFPQMRRSFLLKPALFTWETSIFPEIFGNPSVSTGSSSLAPCNHGEVAGNSRERLKIGDLSIAEKSSHHLPFRRGNGHSRKGTLHSNLSHSELENINFHWEDSLYMGMFHSYATKYRRVNPIESH